MENVLKRWKAKVSEHIRNPAEYQKAVEENKRLGISPSRSRTLKERIIKLNSAPSRRSVSLSGQSKVRIKSEREIAEDNTVTAIKDVIDILQYHLDVLTNTPNPASPSTFKNRVNQSLLMEAVRRLGNTTYPSIQTNFTPKKSDSGFNPFGEPIDL